jgi:deoxyadenosine/deoxycytidine kinase
MYILTNEHSIINEESVEWLKKVHTKFIDFLSSNSFLKEHEELLYRDYIDEYYNCKVIQKDDGYLIALVGCIGCGKTTLADDLSEKLNLSIYNEPAFKGDDPYLVSFYKDKKTWAFFIEMYLLLQRKRGIKNGIEIADRSFEEDVIFAKVLYEDDNMTKDEFSIYLIHFNLTLTKIKTPNLYIYLKSSTKKSYDNVQERMKKDITRASESSIDFDYLDKLNSHYDFLIKEQIGEKNVMTLDWESFDDTEKVIDLIDKFKNK